MAVLVVTQIANPVAADAFDPDETADQAVPIACGETQFRTIAPPGDHDWLSFALDAPAEVRVDVDSNGYPLLTAFDESAALLRTGFPDVDFLCGSNALSAGSYRLRVSAAFTFEYSLTLTCSPCLLPNPTPTATPSTMPTPTITPTPTI